MDLQDQLGIQPALCKPIMDADHGDLHDVGGGALDGGVHGHPLTELLAHLVGLGQLGDEAAAAQLGGDEALLVGGLDDLVQVAVDVGVAVQVTVDIGLGLGAGNMQVLGQGMLPHAVHDAEVDGLGLLAKLHRDVVLVYAEDAGGGVGMDIEARDESVPHGGVSRDIRQEAQLDLGVVGVDEDTVFGGGNEELAKLTAQLGADGDVLEVGLGGGETARGGARLLEGGVYQAAVVCYL